MWARIKNKIWNTKVYTVDKCVKTSSKIDVAQHQFDSCKHTWELKPYANTIKLKWLDLVCDNDHAKLQVENWFPFYNYIHQELQANQHPSITVQSLFGSPFLLWYGENNERFYFCNAVAYSLLLASSVTAIAMFF